MRAAWPTAGSSPEFSLRLRVHHQLYWLSGTGSSIDGRGVTGGGQCREGR